MMEEMKLKQAEIEAKRKEIQEKMTGVELKSSGNKDELELIYRDYDRIGDRIRDVYRDIPVVVMPEVSDVRGFSYEDGNNIYLYRGYGTGSKPGSSWNYSRQVMEASFTNEFTMSADDSDNVNLSVSGDCAEGSISVAIIMPDGKQLSEVVLDENGSLNWRKSFEAEKGNGWKSGKWTFRIKAKDATGNLRISMNSY
jgi:hypothetical protein